MKARYKNLKFSIFKADCKTPAGASFPRPFPLTPALSPRERENQGQCFRFSISILLVLLAVSGCSKKIDVKAQASELEKAFPAAVATAAAAQAETLAPAQAPTTDANAYVSAALSAVRNNDYAESVIALQKVQRMPGVTYEQFLAIERTRQAMNTDLINRADRGDAKAKAELRKIEKTLSQ